MRKPLRLGLAVSAFRLLLFVGLLLAALAKPAASAEPASCATIDAARLLSAYFSFAESDKKDGSLDAVQATLARQGVSIQFLIATVPEPRLGFDGTIEAITRALEATGFLLDRYLLPWNAMGEKRVSDSSCPLEQPGIALFQRREVESKAGTTVSSRRSLLLLYVVGESPVAGIHKPAFVRAVDDIQRLSAIVPGSQCASCAELRVIGPAFSGSVVSIEQLLDRYPSLSFRFLSGRATNGAIRDQIQRHDGGVRRVQYQATVIPDEALQTEFFCYLTETMGADEHDIALITESSTGYGQAVIAANADQSQGLPPPHARVVSARPLQKSEHCKRAHRPRLMLPVPLHISRLHTLEAKTGQSSSRTESSALPEILPSPTTRPCSTSRSARASPAGCGTCATAEINSHILWCHSTFRDAALQAIEKMFGMTFNNKLNMAFFPIFTGLCSGDKNISQFGLHLWVQMNFWLLHPDSRIRRVIKCLNQGWQNLRYAKAHISNLDLTGGGVGFDHHLIFLPALSDRLYCKTVDNSQVFEPLSNKGIKSCQMPFEPTIQFPLLLTGS